MLLDLLLNISINKRVLARMHQGAYDTGAVRPTTELNVPTLQGIHVEIEMAPTAALYVPAPHLTH